MKLNLVGSISLLCAGLLACSTTHIPAPAEPSFPAQIHRGSQLAHGLAACGYCHGAQPRPRSPLTGGREFIDEFGPIQAPNITNGPNGIGSYSLFELMRVIRSSLRPDGTELSPSFHRGYTWMSDDDALSIATYLRAHPAAGSKVPRRSLSFMQRNTTGLFARNKQAPGMIPAISPSFTTAYGAYLVNHLSDCGRCHNGPGGLFSEEAPFDGGKTITAFGKTKVAPNITSKKSGILAAWSEPEIVHFLQSAKSPQGREVDLRFCPVGFYSQAPVTDLAAVAAYLKTIK